MAVNEKRVLRSAAEAVDRFWRTLMPLKNITRDIINEKRLNSSERASLRDLVFSWCRNYFVIEAFFSSQPWGNDFLKLACKEKDALTFTLIRDDEQHPDIVSLRKSFKDYRDNLKEEAFLLALGPELGAEIKGAYQKYDASIVAAGLNKRAIEYLAFDARAVTKEELTKAISALSFTAIEHPFIATAIGIKEGGFDVKSLPKKFHGGIVWVMDAASQLVASMIEADGFASVLDMCAGTGQKTRFLAASTNAHLTAMDSDERRLFKAKQSMAHKNITFVTADGRNPPFPKESFDVILLDAPCSGTGVLRRQFDSIFRFSKRNLEEYCSLQASLLKSAVQLLKPGGVLVYATCSILPKENEYQINRVLKDHSNMVGYRPNMLSQLSFMQTKEREKDYSLQLFPHVHQTDGLFFACLRKTTN